MICSAQALANALRCRGLDAGHIYEMYDLLGSKHTPLTVMECGVNEWDDAAGGLEFYLFAKNQLGDHHIRIFGETYAYFAEAFSQLKCQCGQTGTTVMTNHASWLTRQFPDANVKTLKILRYVPPTPTPCGEQTVAYRKLTLGDRALVSRYCEDNREIMGDMEWPLDYLYDCCVIHPEYDYGEVYAAIADHRIIGYLACNKMYENVWDVMHVYIHEPYRRRGYGQGLIRCYADSVLGQKGDPYYTNPVNMASERAAAKAGFALVGQQYFVNV